MTTETTGVLPLSPMIKARLHVADEMVVQIERAGCGVIDGLFHELHKALAATAETSAQDVSVDCVFIYHAGPGDHPFTQAYVATWMPGPRAKAELRGGHVDGQLFELERDARGWPTPILRVPAPLAPAWSADLGLAPVMVVHPTYKLVGFRNDPAVWVYDLST